MFADKRSPLIVEKALSLGATLAGMAAAKAISKTPAHKTGGAIDWPKGARSALVLALAHSEAEPELDWWGVEMGTAGNKRLHSISVQLKQWLYEELKINAWIIPYQPEKNGIFLKDAAVLAGLGTIGANNLLLNPNFGPRLRLRALFLDVKFKPSAHISFSPCRDCSKPCWQSCPRQAFVSGVYDMTRCKQQMLEDEAKKPSAANSQAAPVAFIKYCRACELSCPVGNGV